jgi:cobalt-zinc-cadmium resistance protein CzcA
VRNRDLKSVVKDIQTTIEKSVTLKPGTYVEYGGQFENLENATNRLLIAVPVALLLIFIFLHFAFKSFKDAIMIFTAIPLATVGGVFLLWIRGMPFSVSAGVGFIALFGIAVLNGIVLIEHLKELRSNGVTTMRELIIEGTKARLRPVLLTAGAAAMGFLPMAISTGAGAEVQRPLATVVIGGLVTSTMLTMIALPLLFEIFYNVVGVKFFPLRFIRSKACMVLLVMAIPTGAAFAQSKPVSMDGAVQIALMNNPDIKACSLTIQEKKILTSSAYDFDKTVITYGTDQNNVAANGYPLKVLGIQQSFAFPTVYLAELKLKQDELTLAEATCAIEQERVAREVSKTYLELQTHTLRAAILTSIDSMYLKMLSGAEIRFKQGDISQLDYLTMKVRQQQSKQQLAGVTLDMAMALERLKMLMGLDTSLIVSEEMPLLEFSDRELSSFSAYRLYNARNALSESVSVIERRKMLPDFSVNYFVGRNFHENAQIYHGFEAGVSVPLLFFAQRSRSRASVVAMEAEKQTFDSEIEQLRIRKMELLQARSNIEERLVSYRDSGEMLYSELMKAGALSYEAGEIDFFRFAGSVETALRMKLDQLDAMLNYNLITLDLIYLTK